MSSVTDIYTKNYSEERKKEFEDRVREMEDGVMSEESIASMVAAEMREGKKFGGRMGFKDGNGVADKSAQQKKFSERVIKLMDEEGYDFGEAVKEAMKEGYATGGRAGYYGGGQAMVGEDLSEIGHGSDSLMARNMQLAPNSMATTSTGLNYLLGQDNDTARVPYNKGNMVLPKPKPRESDGKKVLDLLAKNKKASQKTLGSKTLFNLVGQSASEAYKKGEITKSQYDSIIKPFFGEPSERLSKTIDQEQSELRANGGRIGYASKGDVSLLDFINVNASGNKTGKNQIIGAPEGITVDSSTINAIIDLDIPINEKINILGSYAYGKGRNKIEKGEKELFLDEGGYKDRNIGLGFNQGGEGLSGSVIRNLETGDDDVQIKFLKKFSKGGIAGILDK